MSKVKKLTSLEELQKRMVGAQERIRKPRKGKLDLGRGAKADEPVPNPLDKVEYTGNVEEDGLAEYSALLEGFKDRQAKDDDRFDVAVDTAFWFAVYFQSGSQKRAFLEAIGWDLIGDYMLDGVKLAVALGVELPEVHLANKETRRDKKLIAFPTTYDPRKLLNKK